MKKKILILIEFDTRYQNEFDKSARITAKFESRFLEILSEWVRFTGSSAITKKKSHEWMNEKCERIYTSRPPPPTFLLNLYFLVKRLRRPKIRNSYILVKLWILCWIYKIGNKYKVYNMTHEWCYRLVVGISDENMQNGCGMSRTH